MSTELAVIDTVDYISSCLDNKITTCSVFLDLSKAFNTVNHKILLRKMEKSGIRGHTLKLMENYLKNRIQVTKVISFISQPLEINVGVPQGSCLGPLLFIIYINDIALNSNFNIRLFADDAVSASATKIPKY